MSCGFSGIVNDADAGNRPTSGRRRYRPHKPKVQRQQDTSLGPGKALIAAVDARSEPIDLPRLRDGGTASKVSASGFPVVSRQSGTKTIYVKNLRVDVTDGYLKELFAKVGPLENAEVDPSTQYGPEIWAVVDFKTPGDAARAKKRFHNTCQPKVSGSQRLHIEIHPYVEPVRPALSDATQSRDRLGSPGKQQIQASAGYDREGDQLSEDLNTAISGRPIDDYIPSFKPFADAMYKDLRRSKVPDIAAKAAQPVSSMTRPASTASKQSLEMRSLLIKNVRNTINRGEIRHVFRPVGKVMWIHVALNATATKIPTSRAIVDFETFDQASFALEFLDGERSTICGRTAAQVEWSRDSAVDSDLANPRKSVPSQAASGLASPFAWNQPKVADGGRPPGSGGVHRLSPGAQTFLPGAPTYQSFGYARAAGAIIQDSDRTQQSLQKVQRSEPQKSSTVQIDNLDCNWTPSEVTCRLKKVVRVDFEPSVVSLFRFPETAINRSTRITFVNAATAEQAAERIRVTKLDGTLKLQVYCISDYRALVALWRKGPRRVRLDNVCVGWQWKDLYNRLVTVMEDMTGCVINIKAVPTEYEGTLSYIVIFDSPTTAAEMHSRLDNQSIGGPDRLGASVILPR